MHLVTQIHARQSLWTPLGLVLCGVIWLATGGAAWAQKTAYQCAIDGTSDRQVIQPVIFFALDRAIDRVVVSDASILASNNGVPVEGRLIKDNAARVTVAWSLTLRAAGLPRQRLSYRATYLKATGKVNVSARTRVSDGVFNKAGTCIATNLSG